MIRPVVRDELFKLGIKSCIISPDEVDCRRQLAKYPGALLVFDWEWGEKVAGKVLQAASTAPHEEPRPLYILAMQSSFEIVAIGLEYRAARVHLGELTATSAAEHLRQILDRYVGKTDTDAAFLQVYAARVTNDWDGAEKAIRRILDQQPSNERALLELTVNYIGLRQWEKALAVVKDLAQDDLNLRAKGLYARCLMALKRYSEAVVVLEQAHIVHPNHVERLIDLGRSLLKIDRVSEAYDRFRGAFELNQASKEAVFGMSSCKLMQGDINASLDLLRNVSTPEETASIFNSAAILSIRRGRFEHGFKLYHAALATIDAKKKSLIARIFFNMGLAHYRNQDLQKAAEFFQKSADLDVTFVKAPHNVAVIKKQLSAQAYEPATLEILEVGVLEDFEDEKL